MGTRNAFIALLLLVSTLSTVSFVACSTASTRASQFGYYEDGHGHGLRLHGPLLYFQILMNNPRGVFEPIAPPPCSELGGTCDATVGATSGCCGDLQCAAPSTLRFIAGTCCVDNDKTCDVNADCCSGYCCLGGDPTQCDGNPGDGGVCTSGPPCFAGRTLVHVKDKTEPVEMQDVKTGDEILCLASNDDLRVPQALEWCEVMNWGHAETSTNLYYSINYRRPSGGRASLTISDSHLFTKLVGPSVKVGDTQSSMDAFGPFETLRGDEVQAGDLMAVLKDWNNPASSLLQAVEVESVNLVTAGGMYVPQTKNVWIVADGVAVPRFVEFGVPMIDANSEPVTLEGAMEAMTQYHLASGWMRRVQARGVAGKDSYWNLTFNGTTIVTPYMPSSLRVFGTSMQHVRRGEMLNFTKLQEWFLPKLQAWRVNNSNTLTTTQIVTALNSPGMFVNVTTQSVRRQWEGALRAVKDFLKSPAAFDHTE